MLTFRNTNIVFVMLMVTLLVLSFYMHISLWVFITIAFVYSLVIFYGSYYVGSNFFMKVICSGNTNEKKLAISFDDGPALAHSNEVLDILEKHKVPAAFFCIGNRVSGNEKLLKRMHEQGHIIGNHSYSHHFWFDMFPANKMLEDIKAANKIISETIAVQPQLFRPPYGVTTPGMKKALEAGNFIPVGWNIRSMDTMIKDDQKLFNKVSAALKPGAILLFHDTCASTVRMLPAFITDAKQKGYEFVRLDKLINKEAYA